MYAIRSYYERNKMPPKRKSVRRAAKKEGRTLEVQEGSLVRQCDKEYIDSLDDWKNDYDAIVSMACGVGVNFIANLRPSTVVYPAVV